MTRPVRISIAGAGLIGRRHADAIAACPGVELHSVVDPFDPGRAYAESIGARWHASLTDLFSADRPDGVILATPNQLHVDNGLECVKAGVPALIEEMRRHQYGEELIEKIARRNWVALLQRTWGV